MQTARRPLSPASRAAAAVLMIAAAAGVAHGSFSLYWAAGGNWLLATLGHQLVSDFAGRRWLLFPVGVVKIGFAVFPLALVVWGRPWPRLGRLMCWLGAVVLMAWGGINTITGNLVLFGVIDPSGGYDRVGMIGHARLWDPLFLLWGVALTAGLLLSRRHVQ